MKYMSFSDFHVKSKYIFMKIFNFAYDKLQKIKR